MESGIRILVEKDREVASQIEDAIAKKEETKQKAVEDAEIEIGIIIKEQNEILEKKLLESKKYLNEFYNKKEQEFLEIKNDLIKITHSNVVEELFKIILEHSDE